jgi:hypothetical protein
MAAAFGRDLIFDVDGGSSRSDEVFDGTHDIDCIAEAGIGIGNYGDFHGTRDITRDHHDFIERDQADVRFAEQRCRHAVTGDTAAGETGFFNDLGGQRVVGAGFDKRFAAAQQLAQLGAGSGAHVFLRVWECILAPGRKDCFTEVHDPVTCTSRLPTVVRITRQHR